MKKQIGAVLVGLTCSGIAAAQMATTSYDEPQRGVVSVEKETAVLRAALCGQDATPARPTCLYADKRYGQGSIVKIEGGKEIVCIPRDWGYVDRDNPVLVWEPITSDRVDRYTGKRQVTR